MSSSSPSTTPNKKSYTYIVEHLDPDLESWSTLEYATIATETQASGSTFILTSVPTTLLPLPTPLQDLLATGALHLEHRSVEELFPPPAPGSTDEAAGAGPGGRVCLLDPKATRELAPEDADAFDVFLFGGILGDDPPRDRTGELRAKGYATRALGPVQMTTDTAVRVTRAVVQGRRPLGAIAFVDSPELRLDAHESVTMPFRYVRDAGSGAPVMPEGMRKVMREDAGKGVVDLVL